MLEIFIVLLSSKSYRHGRFFILYQIALLLYIYNRFFGEDGGCIFYISPGESPKLKQSSFCIATNTQFWFLVNYIDVWSNLTNNMSRKYLIVIRNEYIKIKYKNMYEMNLKLFNVINNLRTNKNKRFLRHIWLVNIKIFYIIESNRNSIFTYIL